MSKGLLSAEEIRSILRMDFLGFMERSFRELNPGDSFSVAPYLEVIATKLEECRAGQRRRLVICLPPRHTKSFAASIAFPVWLLGHNPSERIVCASYGQELSDDFARKSRKIMKAPFYQELFKTRLSERHAVSDFVTTSGGGRIATSVGGTLTGRGGNFLIIDDPMKPDEAMSETRRKSVHNWYDNTLRSRLDNQETGCIIIIMQRLHQDDLVGHVLEQEDWDVLSFPAIAEESERHLIRNFAGERIYARFKGVPLDRTRTSLKTFEQLRKSNGDFVFSAQYQQNPLPLEGNMIKNKWLQYYQPNDLPKRFSLVLLSYDTASKTKEINDYSVGTVWGVADGRYYLLHVSRKRLEYPDLKKEARSLARRYHAARILIEDKGSGQSLIQDLKRMGQPGVKEYTPPPHSDKVMRLIGVTPYFEEGRVFLSTSAPWLTEYVKELTGFPGAKHDDQVDSTSQALAYLKQHDKLEIWARLAKG